ncbi:hypothetical protein [Comamonas guangdongensis]|uniref:DUF1236 domain-containing protein n=1 Tax=Comamonas guangdongensis TaxID=510515 RepID=A0ABV4A0I9_9BURK
MYRALVLLATVVGCAPVWAASAVTNTPLSIQRQLLGSGQQGAQGEEQAQPVGDYGVWHVPQYLPGYPTAATIWPRAVVVKCKDQHCEGYVITPQMGPGEYLFFIPSEE